uniref:Uncharacterized protein n=1 Tax=Arundo donax TaxID=35708 RepID=A0A0A8XWL4_ARUDO
MELLAPKSSSSLLLSHREVGDMATTELGLTEAKSKPLRSGRRGSWWVSRRGAVGRHGTEAGRRRSGRRGAM